MKTLAARRTRRRLPKIEIADGSDYKKLFCHYDINDYR
jgi:hypothetical protein